MINVIQDKVIRIVTPILIATILISCSASQHAGVSYKKRPLFTETRESVWFNYWEDQFDAKGGSVQRPSKEYPEVAHTAYDQAMDVWNSKVTSAKNKTMTLQIIGGAVGFIVLLYVIIPAITPSPRTGLE